MVVIACTDAPIEVSVEEPPDKGRFYPPVPAPAPTPLPEAGSPTSSVGTCPSDIHTPYLCVSSSDTDEHVYGSPTSIGSSMSYAGSLTQGDMADVDDIYDTHSEHDDFDYGPHAPMDAGDLDDHKRAVDALSDKLQQLRYHTPQLGRPVRGSAQNHLQAEPHHRDRDSALPCSYSRSCSTSCLSRLGRGKKGRLSELIAYGDDLPRSTTPPPQIQNSAAPETQEWEIEMLPPAPAHNCVSPMDTIPPVRSPLSTCTNADGAVHTTKTISPELRALCESSSRSASTSTAREPSSDTACGSCAPRTRAGQKPRVARDDDDTSDDTAAKNTGKKPPARTALKRRTSRRRQRSVRFCTSPPTQVDTHNAEDYDRTAHPLNNRLSPHDVEELRELKLGIGLLESKYAMLHAQGDDERHTEDNFQRRLSTDIPHAGETAELSLSPQEMRPPVFRRNSEMAQEAAGNTQQEAPRGRPVSKLGSALAARFGLHSPPPPLPGMEHSLGTQSAPISRRASPRRGYSPSSRDVPVRVASPGLAGSPHLEAVCESPVADLCDSGSEYDYLG